MRQYRSKNVALVAALARSNMTQRELARLTGLHHVTISTAVNNRVDVAPETASRIAAALGADPIELFPEIGEGGVR